MDRWHEVRNDFVVRALHKCIMANALDGTKITILETTVMTTRKTAMWNTYDIDRVPLSPRQLPRLFCIQVHYTFFFFSKSRYPQFSGCLSIEVLQSRNYRTAVCVTLKAYVVHLLNTSIQISAKLTQMISYVTKDVTSLHWTMSLGIQDVHY